jgi:hypothetical protein
MPASVDISDSGILPHLSYGDNVITMTVHQLDGSTNETSKCTFIVIRIDHAQQNLQPRTSRAAVLSLAAAIARFWSA